MKKVIIPFVMATTLILVTVSSCTKETWEGLFGHDGSNRIQAVVSSSSVQTKAGLSGAGDRFLGTIPFDGFGGDSLCIAVYEFDNDDLPQELSGESSPQTKGAVVSTSRINQNGQQFTMNAWLESSGRLADDAVHFMSATATRSGGSWSLASTDPSDTPDGPWNKWRNQVPTNFWAMYPASLNDDQGLILEMSWPVEEAGDGAQKTVSFSYILPTTRTDSREAEYMPDLCFAYSHKTWNESTPGNDNKVNIDFKHALSAVYFTTSGVLNSITVKKIGLQNVPSLACCEMTGTGGNPGTLDIKWTDQDCRTSIIQTYQSSDFVTFEGYEKTLNLNESSKVFMMIPDTLTRYGTKLWAEFEVKGVSVKKYVDISKFSDGTPVVWKPGKRYLYKLMFNGYENFTFYFDETGHPTATVRSYTNTTSFNYQDIPVVSAAVNADNVTVSDVDWYIKEVIRNKHTTTVNDTSFDSSVGHGFSAVKKGNNIRVISDERNIVYPGKNAYWTNPANEDWAPADWSSYGVIDLSKTDFSSDDPTKINTKDMTTANCYIIRHAGTYRLPLVYGNAIKNGTTNTQSYEPTMAAGGITSEFYNGTTGTFLDKFVNSANANISSPFIENNTEQTANEVIILWQDEADAIELDNSANPIGSTEAFYNKDNVRYIQFTVPQSKICQNNALIAVTNSNGEVLWSWHIWITNNPDLLKPAIPVKNHANNIYNFFPLPCLGWIEDGVYPARDDIKIVLEQRSNGDAPKNTITLTVQQPNIYTGNPNGCYYQFGRKDPMCRKNTPAYYHTERPFSTGGAGKASLADAIKNPEVYYSRGSGNSDWCKPAYFNLWSGGYSNMDLIESSEPGLSKTVYDPSPRGYMMPAPGAFTGFTTTGANAYESSEINGTFNNGGWYFKTAVGDNTIFFPAVGFRNADIKAPGEQAKYWAAVCHTGYYYGMGREMSLGRYEVFAANGDCRVYGLAARPVPE